MGNNRDAKAQRTENMEQRREAAGKRRNGAGEGQRGRDEAGRKSLEGNRTREELEADETVFGSGCCDAR